MSIQPSSPTTLTTYLWFDSNASEAAEHYISTFPSSHITHTTYYSSAGQAIHGKDPGSVQSVSFTLGGKHNFVALNGGTHFKLSAATSFQIDCEDQEEVDYYWSKLGDGGDVSSMRCGWVTDRFGVTWQVTPKALGRMLRNEDGAKVKKVVEKMMGMRKLDVAELQAAFDGTA